ncbi:hypothetical protein HWI79_884 [Cryptosporidium felis]|nr:hypothetical protein HWI79_884 [Cryptosporidium felis]
MRFASTGDFRAEGSLSENPYYLNRPNALGFSKRDFRTRSVEQSAKVAKRTLSHLLPELGASQFNESLRLFRAYLASFRSAPKAIPKIETLVSACAYISVRKDGGYLSLLYLVSRLKSRSYRSFASLVRRVCLRLRISRLPNPSLEESLNQVCASVERLLRGEDSETASPPEEVVLQIEPRQETEEGRNLVLEALIGDAPQEQRAGRTSHSRSRAAANGGITGPKASRESLLKARSLALLILETALGLEKTPSDAQDDVLNPLWLSNGTCSAPLISASLFFSFKLYCRNISSKDLLLATGISRSSLFKARRSLSHRLRLLSQSHFPGWLSDELLDPNSELPPAVIRCIANLIKSSRGPGPRSTS